VKQIIIPIMVLFIIGAQQARSQQLDATGLKAKIAASKKDPKGPYQQIMWHCPDGSKVPPRERCPEKGGVQRATYKPWIDTLAARQHLFLGQILAATDFAAFLDEEKQFSRLKQYQLEQYLRTIDNGWILQKARFYRGAFQDEDENAWGSKFLIWALTRDDLVRNRFFMLRQASKDIPHKAENNNLKKVRALSMAIADTLPAFMEIRVKIHGQPDASDVKRVKDFKLKNKDKLGTEVLSRIDSLLVEMDHLYRPVDWQSLDKFLKPLSNSTTASRMLQVAISAFRKAIGAKEKVSVASSLLLDIRKSLPAEKAKTRLALMDLSNRVEELLFGELPSWEAKTLGETIEKNYHLSMAAAGAGFIELWEWDSIAPGLKPIKSTNISLAQLNEYMVRARRVVEWSTAMMHVNFHDEIVRFEAFEPLVSGFQDDRIRSSVLLQLGQSVSALGTLINTQSSLTNKVFNIPDQSHFRGINPGFAKGELVVTASPEGIDISADKIYVFQYPPSDLKPVAGIATVSEGNLVSHVQLLARNLGIPNAVLSPQNLNALKAYAGKQVFYAVSNKGTVVMKLASEMLPEEKALFEAKKRAVEKIKVPIDKIDLRQQTVLNLRQVDAGSSGRLCGPKAANLGQLKKMFPDHVVEGMVIPFGIFKQHMDQPMPETSTTYWGFLNEVFKEASRMESAGNEQAAIEQFLLSKLEVLRYAILKMPLKPDFVADLKNQFTLVFGKPMGSIPVFERSDTNMEDLKDFTGAGLNLTLFNVVEEEKILQGIKQVWASPYSERSFRWRQSYLLNPENVYPSILIIPSVNVDYSGVLITKGVSSGNKADLTVAFSHGAGGAVDGQAAETYLLKPDGTLDFIAPSREPLFNMLPATGGTRKDKTTFEKPILNQGNISAIRDFAWRLKLKMEETKGMQGPFDVELGFLDNKLWLFQVRPFVENRNAAGALYLESITPKTDESKRVLLTEAL